MTIQTKTVRAYYKRFDSSYWGHLCHIDDGKGKPLCGGDRNRRLTDLTSARPLWVHSTGQASCKYCANILKEVATAEVGA